MGDAAIARPLDVVPADGVLQQQGTSCGRSSLSSIVMPSHYTRTSAILMYMQLLKAVSEQGVRLSIRKATLRAWRMEFARHLRQHGIEANATDRAVRGESRTNRLDGIYRAARRGASTHMRHRIEGRADQMRRGSLWTAGARGELARTRKAIERGWRAAGDLLVEHLARTQGAGRSIPG